MSEQPENLDAWEVTPHVNSQYDSCIFFVKDDPQGRKALEYAQESLENLWDTSEALEQLDITVRLRRTTVSPESIDDGL